MSTPQHPAAATLRRATADDVPALAALYAASARGLGPRAYGPAQVAVWAAFAEDAPAFRRYVLDADTWLLASPAAEGAGPLGFANVGADGEVHALYVRPGCEGQGLGTRLLRHVLDEARRRGTARFAAWATPLSRPLFLREGFRLVETVHAPYQGVVFERSRLQYP